jgi:RHS repeat-associated protein
VWDGVFDPFGNPASVTGTVAMPLRFPGQYADPETALNQNWFRDYDPSIGRYVQSDPIGLAGGINTYEYVGGNPVSTSDLLGLIPNPAEAFCVAGPNPVCAGGVLIDVGTNLFAVLLGAGAGAAAATGAATAAKAVTTCPSNCAQLIAQINALVGELKWRYAALVADKLKLPPTGKMSVGGHQQQFRNKQKQLRGLLSEAASTNCVGYTPDAWKWATRPTPSPEWSG